MNNILSFLLMPASDGLAVRNEVATVTILIVVLIWLVAMVASLVSYILTSLSLFTIADRRRISGAIWAWFPIGSSWLLGTIVDYHESLHGIKRRWRTLLLVMNVIPIVGYVLMMVLVTMLGLESSAFVDETMFTASFVGIMVAIYAVMIFAFALPATVLSICTWVCYYKLFEALAPLKAVKYLVISLLVPFGSVFCLMKCRNSLLGVPQPPVYAPGPYGGPAPVYYSPAPFGEPAPAPVPAGPAEPEPVPATNPVPNAQPENIPGSAPSPALPKDL